MYYTPCELCVSVWQCIGIGTSLKIDRVRTLGLTSNLGLCIFISKAALQLQGSSASLKLGLKVRLVEFTIKVRQEIVVVQSRSVLCAEFGINLVPH